MKIITLMAVLAPSLWFSQSLMHFLKITSRYSSVVDGVVFVLDAYVSEVEATVDIIETKLLHTTYIMKCI